MAEGMGFEPTEPERVHSLSRGARSTTLAPFQNFIIFFQKKWRRDRDSNPGCPNGHNGFQDRRLRPLSHLSKIYFSKNIEKWIVRMKSKTIHYLYLYGSPDWIRTSDQMVNSHLLYHWATEEYILLNYYQWSKKDFIFSLKKVKLFFYFFLLKIYIT